MENKKQTEKINPRVKDVLELLGIGVFLGASLFFPGLPMMVKEIENEIKEKERQKAEKEWKKFNLPRLRFLLKRIKKQKLIKVDKRGEKAKIVLTEKGKKTLLSYRLEEIIMGKPPKWDRKWRLIIYDISEYKKNVQEAFRNSLKRLKFFPLQRSVYLYPYPCKKEIDFLRYFYGIGDDVLIMRIDQLENENALKEYFGL